MMPTAQERASQVGLCHASSSVRVLQESTIPTYQRMWNYMEASHERSMAAGDPSISVFGSSLPEQKIMTGKSGSEMSTSDVNKDPSHKDQNRKKDTASSYRH